MVYCAWDGAGACEDLTSTTYWPVSGSARNPPVSGICESVPSKSSLTSMICPSGA
jgi:hypothetical protein